MLLFSYENLTLKETGIVRYFITRQVPVEEKLHHKQDLLGQWWRTTNFSHRNDFFIRRNSCPSKPKIVQTTFKTSVRTVKKTQFFAFKKSDWLTLFEEIITADTEHCTKPYIKKCGKVQTAPNTRMHTFIFEFWELLAEIISKEQLILKGCASYFTLQKYFLSSLQ